MIQDYLNELKINGKSKNTLTYQESILKETNAFKELPGWTKDDVNRFILALQGKNKKSSVEVKKAILKRFFTWAGKRDIVEHLKIKFPRTSLKRDDILEIPEINLMIETTNSPMYKAIIAFFFESGGRVNEILPSENTKGILVEEIRETDKGMIIPVHGTKTGDEDRSILCIFSAQYIRNHIAYSGLSKGDVLFPVKRPAVHVMLNKIAKKAGIEKPISPHKFRHAQAVDMLKRGYQDQITKKKLGWKDDSRMLARYSHVIDDDVIDATLEKAGTDIPRKPIANIKQTESLKIADASMQFNKLSEDYESLKTKYEEQQQQLNSIINEDMIKAMISTKVKEMMNKS
jgi:integrase/recombinase XerD